MSTSHRLEPISTCVQSHDRRGRGEHSVRLVELAVLSPPVTHIVTFSLVLFCGNNTTPCGRRSITAAASSETSSTGSNQGAAQAGKNPTRGRSGGLKKNAIFKPDLDAG